MTNKQIIKTEIPASKSLFNRALIVQSFFSNLKLLGQSSCDDVKFAQSALMQFQNGQDIYCGEGGTTFRFLCVRVSRQKGKYRIFAKSRLLERPQQGLVDLLKKLNCEVTVHVDHFELICSGWGDLSAVQVDTSESSQYATALVLSAWLLPQDLKIELIGKKVSEGYFSMTLELVKELGMNFQIQGNEVLIPAGQVCQLCEYRVESDVSSAFSVAAFGVLNAGVEFSNFPFNSRQPDLAFLNILKELGVRWDQRQNSLFIPPTENLQGIEVDLFNCPDLFPVLSVLCAFASGTSRLFNAPHLVSKESNRIAKTSELLENSGIRTEQKNDGMLIFGGEQAVRGKFVFDPDQDHRMVMAASILKSQGVEIEILHKEAVAKSFPEFFQTIGA